MKKLLTIFALLCVSAVGWAYTSEPGAWIGSTDATYANQFKWYEVDGVTTPNDVVNIQQPGWATAIGIYMNFADAAFNAVYLNDVLATNGTEYKQDGAGMVVYLSALTAKNTTIVIKNGETTRFGLRIFNDKGEDPIESEYCGYQGSETQQDGHYVTLTWETNASGNVVITIGTGDNSTSCSYRNGGFEGDNNGVSAFVVSADNFATSSPATDYFTAARPSDGDLTYTLTKIADLPANAKIKHLSSSALAWSDNGTGRWCFPEFIYTYGGKCIEEPELTKINLTASTNLAKVGVGVTLTATPKDQFGQDFDAVVSFSVNPTDAGSIVGNVYTPSKLGAAVITATSGDVNSTITIYGVSSDNLAQGKETEAGYNPGNTAEQSSATVDGNANTAWVTWADRPEAEEWLIVDLEDNYDLTAVDALWGADYSTNYIIQVRDDAPSSDDKADDEAWTTLATVTTASSGSEIFTSLSGSGRYVRLHSLNRSGKCIRLRELRLFGTVKATATKAVSASVNDAEMGSATVKQNGVAVTEVETGTEVTFSAVANDGYVFTGWSNDESRATFTTTVNSTMNLTANFRAIKTVYCMTEMEKNGHTIYVTMKRSAANTYQLVVKSDEELQGFGNAYFYRPNNIQVGNISQMQELSDNNHTLTATMTAATEPYMTTPLYVVIRGVGEVTYDQLTDIEYAAECDDNASVTSVTISRTTASVAVGDEFDLTAQVVPAYATNKNITWASDNTSVATVTSAGHVTTLAEGTAHITATSEDGGHTATCTVTVNAELETQTYWGNGKDPNYDDIAIAYSITRNADHKLTYAVEALQSKVGFIVQVNDDGDFHTATRGDDGIYRYTSASTYEEGAKVNGFFYMPFDGGAARVDFRYTVGSSSDHQEYIPIEFDDNATNATWINDNDGQTRDVEIDRPMAADSKFKTLCLPFSMNAAQIAETFGECEILRLKEAHMKSETDMYVGYERVSTIEAGYPYLITLLDENKSKLDFSAVTINSATTYNTITVDAGNGKGVKMIGTFVKVDRSSEAEFYLDASDNLLHSIGLYCSENSVASLSIPAFRCYFQLVGFDDPTPVMARVMRIPEVATGIENTMEANTVTKQFKDGQLFIIRDGNRYTVTGMKVE